MVDSGTLLDTDKVIREILWAPRRLCLLPLGDDLELSLPAFYRWLTLIVIGFTLLAFEIAQEHDRVSNTKMYLLSAERASIYATVALSTAWLLIRRYNLLNIKIEIQKIAYLLDSKGIEMLWKERLVNMNMAAIFLIFLWSPYQAYISTVKVLYSLYCMILIISILHSFVEFLRLVRYISVLLIHVHDTECVVQCLDSVYAICDNLMDSYGLIIFIVISSMFTRILCNLYIQFTSPIDYINFLFFGLASYPILIILRSTSKTSSKVNELNCRICERNLVESNNECLEFYLIARHEIQLSASGFFNLENSIICSMISSATTYLVILLQYSTSNLRPPNS